MNEVKNFFDNYKEFVDGVTSNPSKDFDAFIERLHVLKSGGCDIQRLLTAEAGLGAESGEFCEIVKKIAYQGKPYDEDNIFHMQRELGDVIWYIMQACIALNLDFHTLVEENVRKLESRYPGGNFNIYKSENREIGDL